MALPPKFGGIHINIRDTVKKRTELNYQVVCVGNVLLSDNRLERYLGIRSSTDSSFFEECRNCIYRDILVNICSRCLAFMHPNFGAVRFAKFQGEKAPLWKSNIDGAVGIVLETPVQYHKVRKACASCRSAVIHESKDGEYLGECVDVVGHKL